MHGMWKFVVNHYYLAGDNIPYDDEDSNLLHAGRDFSAAKLRHLVLHAAQRRALSLVAAVPYWQLHQNLQPKK